MLRVTGGLVSFMLKERGQWLFQTLFNIYWPRVGVARDFLGVGDDEAAEAVNGPS